jgi:hypothetical protein
MKNSKKISRLLSHVEQIEDVVSYYLGNNNKYSFYIREIRTYIDETALDTKTHDIRLAKKLKGLWKKKNGE